MELLQRWAKWSSSFWFWIFKYKTSITGNTYNVDAGEAGYDANKVGKNETEIAIPLKHLSSFWRSLNIPVINCEVELILTWSKNSVLADMTPANHPPGELSFKTTDTIICSSCYFFKRL